MGTSAISASPSSICIAVYSDSSLRKIFFFTNPEMDFPITRPKSQSFSFDARLSFSHSVARRRHVAKTAPLKSAGRAYGYLMVQATPCGFPEKLNTPVGPNSEGRFATGSAKHPPIANAITLPELNISGGARNARVWCFRSFTISAVIVLITPSIPFAIPANILQNNNIPIVLEKPNDRFAITLMVSPMRIVGFRPYVSDRRPQSILVAI